MIDNIKSHGLFKNDISYIRANKNISQSKLAKLVGIERFELSRIENGHNIPRKEVLEKIAKELGVLITELYPLDLQKVILKYGK